jgi:hypothetical protein
MSANPQQVRVERPQTQFKDVRYLGFILVGISLGATMMMSLDWVRCSASDTRLLGVRGRLKGVAYSA